MIEIVNASRFSDYSDPIADASAECDHRHYYRCKPSRHINNRKIRLDKNKGDKKVI